MICEQIEETRRKKADERRDILWCINKCSSDYKAGCLVTSLSNLQAYILSFDEIKENASEGESKSVAYCAAN